MSRLPLVLVGLGLGVLLLPVAFLLRPDAPAPPPAEPAGLSIGRSGPDDNLAAALRRCRDAGRAALEDPSCLALWDETRRRFLGVEEGRTEEGGTRSDRITNPRLEAPAPPEMAPDGRPADGALPPPFPED